jgi:hypothetical protein
VRPFDKSESSAHGACSTGADASATQAAMEAIAAAVVATVSGAATTTTSSSTTSTVPTTTSSTVPGIVSYATHVQPIFDTNCVFCHTGAFPPVGLNLSSPASYANLVDVSSRECPGTKRVDPGSPSTSYLMHKIVGSGPCFVGSPMPLHLSPLPALQQATISTWILQGAMND